MNGTNDKNIALQLYSSDGKLIIENHPTVHPGSQNIIQVDLSNLKTGLYFCKISSSTKQATRILQVIR
jgi:hypothetical protein